MRIKRNKGELIRFRFNIIACADNADVVIKEIEIEYDGDYTNGLKNILYKE